MAGRVSRVPTDVPILLLQRTHSVCTVVNQNGGTVLLSEYPVINDNAYDYSLANGQSVMWRSGVSLWAVAITTPATVSVSDAAILP